MYPISQTNPQPGPGLSFGDIDRMLAAAIKAARVAIPEGYGMVLVCCAPPTTPGGRPVASVITEFDDKFTVAALLSVAKDLIAHPPEPGAVEEPPLD